MDQTKDRPKERPLRAVIYCRTSGDDSDLAKQAARKAAANKEEFKKLARKEIQKISIEEQRKLCTERCEKLGYEVIAPPFADINISGRTYPEGFDLADPAFDDYFNSHIKRGGKRVRPELGKLLKLKQIDVIVVRDIYRLLRPAFQSHLGNHLWQILTKRKIKIHSISDGDIDTAKFEDLMITNLKLQIADQAKRQEVEAATRSLRALKNDGKLATGVKCYGLKSRHGEPQKVDTIPKELKIVRIMYEKYLGGMSLFGIARHLNDDLKIKTREGKMWTVATVRKILLRPWYCGLQYNTDKQLIPSKVMPSGADAIVSTDEYYWVLASFEKRERFKGSAAIDPETGKAVPGPKIGSQRGDHPIHPLSGLVKCGICGKNLYIVHVVNKYYDEKYPIKQYHYICKTAHDTKGEEYADCRRVRIKEFYPPEALAKGITPAGYGLIECLYPLMFIGYIDRYSEQVHGVTELTDKKSYLQFELDKVAEYEQKLFEDRENEIVDKEQFATGMKRCREKRDEFRRRLQEVEKALADVHSDSVSVPDQHLLDYSKIPRATIQEMAHATFKEILVYPDKIRVVFLKENPKTGKSYQFDLERIRNRNAKDLPFWNVRTNKPALSPDAKIGVAYFYKSTMRGYYRKISPPLDMGRLEIMIVGENESVDKKRAGPLTPVTSFDAYLRSVYGDMPGYKTTLEVNSTGFFGPLVTELEPKEREP